MNMHETPPFVVCGDFSPRRRPDSLITLGAAGALHMTGAISLLCVIASGPSALRGAACAKTALGIEAVPVGVGAEVGEVPAAAQGSQFMAEPDLLDGYELLKNTLVGARRAVNLLLFPPFTPIARLIRTENPAWLPEQVAHVTVEARHGSSTGLDERFDRQAASDLSEHLRLSEIPTSLIPVGLAETHAIQAEVLEDIARAGKTIDHWLASLLVPHVDSTQRAVDPRPKSLALPALVALFEAMRAAADEPSPFAMEQIPGSAMAVCHQASDIDVDVVVSSLVELARLGLDHRGRPPS